MKILHVIASIDPAGGGPIEGLRQLRTALEPLGVTVEVACCDAPDAPCVKHSPFPVIHAFGPAKLGLYRYAPKLTHWLRAQAQNYDAIIVDGIWQYNLFATYLALRGSPTPYYVFTHGMLDPWFKKTYPLKHLKKWLYWPWSVYPALKKAKAVIFTCEEERLLARRSFWLYSVREAVTHYGTKAAPADAAALATAFLEKHPEAQGKRNLLFLSRIQEKKGCDLLIKAFAKAALHDPALHLIMAGPDQTGWVSQLKEMAQDLNIANRISWTGMLSPQEKWAAYAAAEAFILPSHQENFGIVVAEALASGLPVLISDKVNIWREIADDGAGFVDTDTTEGTTRNIAKWLALSPASYAMMQNQARACFARHFHIDQAARSLLALLKG